MSELSTTSNGCTLALQQAHWRIENRLHWRRDVTLGEDACQVRITGAPQALAALNGGASP